MDLTVEIDGEIGSLEEALTQFTATETLDRDNKYHCIRLGFICCSAFRSNNILLTTLLLFIVLCKDASLMREPERSWPCWRHRTFSQLCWNDSRYKATTVCSSSNFFFKCKVIHQSILQSGNFEKLSKSVRFPEVLNIAPYMSSRTSGRPPLYSLYAVVVHLDIMNAAFSGHYVCYVKSIHGKWFKIDDTSVRLTLNLLTNVSVWVKPTN